MHTINTLSNFYKSCQPKRKQEKVKTVQQAQNYNILNTSPEKPENPLSTLVEAL
jgi:hypothetical protein